MTPTGCFLYRIADANFNFYNIRFQHAMSEKLRNKKNRLKIRNRQIASGEITQKF